MKNSAYLISAKREGSSHSVTVKDGEGRVLGRKKVSELSAFPLSQIANSDHIASDKQAGYLYANMGESAHDRALELTERLIEKVDKYQFEDVLYTIVYEGKSLAEFMSEDGKIISGIGELHEGQLPVYLQAITEECWVCDPFIEVDDAPHKAMSQTIGSEGFIASPSYAAGVSVRVKFCGDPYGWLALQSLMQRIPIGECVKISAMGSFGPISMEIRQPQMHLPTAAYEQVMSLASRRMSANFSLNSEQLENLKIAAQYIAKRPHLNLSELYRGDSALGDMQLSCGRYMDLSIPSLEGCIGDAAKWLLNIDNTPAFNSSWMLSAMMSQIALNSENAQV